MSSSIVGKFGLLFLFSSDFRFANIFKSVSCRGRVGWSDHDQQHCYHHAPKVKPEIATAFVELLMMGVRMPETC
jgi:hypothetical protein